MAERLVCAWAIGLSAIVCLGGCAALGVTSTPTTATTAGAATPATPATPAGAATPATPAGAAGAATAARAATSRAGSGSPAKFAWAQATHEYPSPPPAPQTVTGHQASAVGAIERFTETYINWNAQNVAARLRELAAQSVGQARSAMALAAAGAADDGQLQQGGIANAGTVQAIAPLDTSPDRFVVVTLERTTASNTTAYAGLRPAWHLAIATVVRLSGGGWALSGWQPEN